MAMAEEQEEDVERPEPVRSYLLADKPAARLLRESFQLNGGTYFAFRAYIRAQKRRGGFKSLAVQPATPRPASAVAVVGGATPGLGPGLPPPTPQRPAPALGAVSGRGSLPGGFTFAGMHAVFGAPAGGPPAPAVTSVAFARECARWCAYGDTSGTVHLIDCGATAGGGIVLAALGGHTGPITDLDWSAADTTLLSASCDGTVRAWDTATASLARTLSDVAPRRPTAAAAPPVHCVRFLPANNNLVIMGSGAGAITVVNTSTGRGVGRHVLGRSVRALAADGPPGVVYAGDDAGAVHVMACDARTGVLRLLGRCAPRVPRGMRAPGAMSALAYRGWCAALGGPALLACARGGVLRLFAVPVTPTGTLKLVASTQLPASDVAPVRAAFCPLMATAQDKEFVVAGGADGAVCIYDALGGGAAAGRYVTRMQGHAAAVADVAWSYGADFLASGDAAGVVIVWRREGGSVPVMTGP